MGVAGRRRRGGFTLIEALVAGVILAVVGVAVSLGLSQSTHSLRTSREYRRAAQVLDGLMTKIDLIGPARMLEAGMATEGRCAAPNDDCRWAVEIESLAEPDLYELTLRLTWPTPGGERSAKLATRLYDPAESRNGYLRWEDL